MIIAWVPGVIPTGYNYVGHVFTQLTGGTASGTSGGGATPGTPTYTQSWSVVTTASPVPYVGSSIVKVG